MPIDLSTVEPRVARIVRFFEALRREDLPRFGEVYAADARFKDPFHDVRGVPAIAAIFGHMFETLEAPRFEVLSAIAQGDQAFLTWDLHGTIPGRRPRPLRIHGGTHLRLDDQGRVTLHRDYWDAAEELYAKLPLIGALMRWLQRRAAAA